MKRVCFFKSSFVIRALLVSFSILPFWNFLYSQSEGFSLKTEIYQLKNGLTIYLNEDSALPNIFGAVVVKGGSKRDPADATGIAHYFEHIMFKGTDKIGTLDYVKEKIYLDSIAELYDKLSSVTAAEDKNMIQKKINRLSIKSSEYAIPNETEKILGEMGCAYLNAGTSYDGIAYFNVLPSSQLQKWMMVYSHRFINPVYRLFQSELEAVYEEYNMYSDNRFATALEEYLSHFFPDHPYGVPIIGYPKDLKYPSMSKMHEYFETYYVANNMALILSGNFNIDEVKPMIEKYFGQWRSGKIPEAPDTWKIEPFKGRVEVNKKLTPVKFGLRGYRSVPQNHPDSPLLDVIGMLLTNSAQTGLMDQLVIDNKLMAAQLIGDHRADAGGEYILYIPKLIGQSLKKAENLIEEKLNKLKSGEFDNDLLEAVKMEIIMGHKQNFEDQFNRGYMMIFSFMNEKEWQDILDYPETIKKVTKEDIVTIAKKYFGDNYLSFHSGSGLPKKPETIKPPFENIPAKNTEEKSEFAKMIAETKVASSPPQFIEFGPPGQKTKDVLIDNITDLAHLYWVNNNVNDVFNLKINYGIGTYKMPILEPASEYISLVAPFSMTFADYSKELQMLGGTLNVSASEDYLTVEIIGPEPNIKPILKLIGRLLSNPSLDDRKIKNLYESYRVVEKMNKKDPETLGYALYSYAVYGKESEFLKGLSAKEIKKLKAADLTYAILTALTYEADFHYSGTLDFEQVKENINIHLNPKKIVNKSQSPVKKNYVAYSEPQVFFLEESSALQSKNYMFIKGNTITEKEKPLLNAYYEYLDGGMSSIIFQEIREYRSLAYATGASLFIPFYKDEETSLTSFVGTQADKTQEAIQVMHQIITSQPEKSNRIDMVRSSLTQSINSKKPPFRQISYPVAGWIKQGYDEDPRKKWVNVYETMSFDDIIQTFNNQFYKKPVITTIIGKKKRIGSEWMKEFGKITEVKKKDIIK